MFDSFYLDLEALELTQKANYVDPNHGYPYDTHEIPNPDVFLVGKDSRFGGR